MIELTIDNKKIAAEPGQNLLWTALDNGIDIPHLCAMKDIEPYAGCRLCLVEIEGEKELVASCAREATAGMVVHISTPKLEKLRRLGLELILASHDADCPKCHLHKHCPLQDLAARYRVSLKPRRFPGLYPKAESFEHPWIQYISERCILCTNCVRVCAAATPDHKPILDLRYRGLDAVIGAFATPDEYRFCLTCKKCIDVCPAGALGEQTC